MQCCRLGCLDTIGFLHTSLVLHEDDSNYVLRIYELLDHSDEMKELLKWTLALLISGTTKIA